MPYPINISKKKYKLKPIDEEGKERKMKKKTDGTLTDGIQLPFIIFSSLWEQVEVFCFFLLYSVALSLRSLLSFISWFSFYSGENMVGKEFLPISVPNSFFFSSCLNKIFVK